MGITERFHRRNQYDGAINRRKTPSNAYHNHFEGYKEYYVMNSDGRGKHIERVYIAEYYRRDVSDKVNNLLKAVYPVLYLISIAVIVLAMTRQALINYTVYVAIPQAAVLFMEVLNIFPIIFYVISPRNMTVSDYKNINRLRIMNMIQIIAGAVLMLAGVVYLVLNGFDDGVLTAACFMCFVVSFICILTIQLMERKTEYSIIPNAEKAGLSEALID